jgi:hypothetical protein
VIARAIPAFAFHNLIARMGWYPTPHSSAPAAQRFGAFVCAVRKCSKCQQYEALWIFTVGSWPGTGVRHDYAKWLPAVRSNSWE